MSGKTGDEMYKQFAERALEELLTELRGKYEKTPFHREADMIEAGRLAYAMLEVFQQKLNDVFDFRQKHPYEADDGSPIEGAPAFDILDSQISGPVSELYDAIASFDKESDPRNWEWSLCEGDRVRLEPGARDGVVHDIYDSGPDYRMIIHLDDGETVTLTDPFDVEFLDRPVDQSEDADDDDV